MEKFNKNKIVEGLMNQSVINEGVYKTVVDEEVERKYVFYKSHGGKLEYEVLEMDPNQIGGWEKDGPINDDIEWLEAEAEDSKPLADFLKKEGIIKESRLNQALPFDNGHPTNEECNANTRYLGKKLTKLGIKFTEDFDWIKELTGDIDDSLNLKIKHENGKDFYVGFDRYGFVIDGPAIKDDFDQIGLEETITIIKKLVGMNQSRLNQALPFDQRIRKIKDHISTTSQQIILDASSISRQIDNASNLSFINKLLESIESSISDIRDLSREFNNIN